MVQLILVLLMLPVVSNGAFTCEELMTKVSSASHRNSMQNILSRFDKEGKNSFSLKTTDQKFSVSVQQKVDLSNNQSEATIVISNKENSVVLFRRIKDAVIHKVQFSSSQKLVVYQVLTNAGENKLYVELLPISNQGKTKLMATLDLDFLIDGNIVFKEGYGASDKAVIPTRPDHSGYEWFGEELKTLSAVVFRENGDFKVLRYDSTSKKQSRNLELESAILKIKSENGLSGIFSLNSDTIILNHANAVTLLNTHTLKSQLFEFGSTMKFVLQTPSGVVFYGANKMFVMTVSKDPLKTQDIHIEKIEMSSEIDSISFSDESGFAQLKLNISYGRQFYKKENYSQEPFVGQALRAAINPFKIASIENIIPGFSILSPLKGIGFKMPTNPVILKETWLKPVNEREPTGISVQEN